MHTPLLNKHGLPLVGRVRHLPRPRAYATLSRVTCATTNCRGLALHTLKHRNLCDACYEEGLENIIWRTY